MNVMSRGALRKTIFLVFLLCSMMYYDMIVSPKLDQSLVIPHRITYRLPSGEVIWWRSRDRSNESHTKSIDQYSRAKRCPHDQPYYGRQVPLTVHPRHYPLLSIRNHAPQFPEAVLRRGTQCGAPSLVKTVSIPKLPWRELSVR